MYQISSNFMITIIGEIKEELFYYKEHYLYQRTPPLPRLLAGGLCWVKALDSCHWESPGSVHESVENCETDKGARMCHRESESTPLAYLREPPSETEIDT